MAALGALRLRPGVGGQPVRGCGGRLGRVTTGGVVGGGGGACLFLAMHSGWDCSGCARSDDG